MREYEVIKKPKSLEEVNQTLVFDRGYNAYCLDTSSKLVRFIVIDREEYFKYRAGQFIHLFPEFDPLKHYIEAKSYYLETLQWENVPVGLYEYVPVDYFLPYGCFLFEETNSRGTIIKKVEFSSDTYIDLNPKFDLVQDFKNWKANKEIYTKRGKRAKKGLIFYGPPGNGKTMQITHLAKLAAEEKFRLFFIDKSFSFKDLIQFKKMFERDDSVFVIEEITERVGGAATDELLSFMDGEMSWNNSYVIATTNHPEELPWNIIDRPSRFKDKVEFPNPTEDERRIYLTQMGVPAEDLEDAVKETEGLSLDYLKNISDDSAIEGKSITQLMREYKEMKNKISNRFRAGKLGF